MRRARGRGSRPGVPPRKGWRLPPRPPSPPGAPPDRGAPALSPPPRADQAGPRASATSFAPDTTRISPLLGTPLAHATSGYCFPTEGDCALPSRSRSQRRMRRHPCDDDTSDSPPLANWPSPQPRPARWPPTAGHPWQRRTPVEPSRPCHRPLAGRWIPPAHPCASASSVAMTVHTTGRAPSSADASARPRQRPTAGRRRPLARCCGAPPDIPPPTNPTGRAHAHPRPVGRGVWHVAGWVCPPSCSRARSGVWYTRGPGPVTARRTGGGGCRPTGVRVSATHPGHCAPQSGVTHLSMPVPGPTNARPRPRARAGDGGRRLPGRCHPSRRRHAAHQGSGPATARPRARARAGGGGRRLLEEGDPHLLRFFQVRRISVCLPTTPAPQAHPGRPDAHRKPPHGPNGPRPRAPTGPTGGSSTPPAPPGCPSRCGRPWRVGRAGCKHPRPPLLLCPPRRPFPFRLRPPISSLFPFP